MQSASEASICLFIQWILQSLRSFWMTLHYIFALNDILICGYYIKQNIAIIFHMMRLFHHLKKYAHWYLLGYVFILSWVLALHNIPLYHYKHGFDGAGHVDYMTYIVNNGQLPAAELGWETHQSPIYYWIGAGLISLFGTWKAAQYINIFILWITIGVAIYGLRIIFPKKLEAVLIGAVSLAALPMLNIFPVMVTNELMNTMWSLAVLVFLLKILKTTDEKKYFWNSFFVTVFFVLGYWTKVSIIMISPLIAGVYIYKHNDFVTHRRSLYIQNL